MSALPPEGTRIRLTHMGDDPDPVPVGSEGTVTGTTSFGTLGYQIAVDWDDGRTVALVEVDTFEIIEPAVAGEARP